MEDDARPAAGTTFVPAPQLTIESLDTLKVFSDPLRQQIIEALLDTPKTVKQVASILALAPTKLYYHINLLESHGLIRVTETRVVSGIIEKHYRAAAEGFRLQPGLLAPGQGAGNALEATDNALDTALNALIAPVRGEIRRGVQANLIDLSANAPEIRRVRLWRGVSRLTPDEAEVFYARLEALFSEFNLDEDPKSDTETAYTLFMGIYPSSAGKDAPEKDPDDSQTPR